MTDQLTSSDPAQLPSAQEGAKTPSSATLVVACFVITMIVVVVGALYVPLQRYIIANERLGEVEGRMSELQAKTETLSHTLAQLQTTASTTQQKIEKIKSDINELEKVKNQMDNVFLPL